mmetsp:Transcript_13598/g.29107  ORF Transcript_13598/g.29107 Transcript_13598/m.29107 type:complete len:222 (-) Transcript_13598:132-797(-)
MCGRYVHMPALAAKLVLQPPPSGTMTVPIRQFQSTHIQLSGRRSIVLRRSCTVAYGHSASHSIKSIKLDAPTRCTIPSYAQVLHVISDSRKESIGGPRPSGVGASARTPSGGGVHHKGRDVRTHHSGHSCSSTGAAPRQYQLPDHLPHVLKPFVHLGLQGGHARLHLGLQGGHARLQAIYLVPQHHGTAGEVCSRVQQSAHDDHHTNQPGPFGLAQEAIVA